MIRTLVYLLVSIFLITFLRYVIGIIMKAFGELVQPQARSGKAGSSSAPGTQAAGELRKDPVCGTFVALSASVKETVGGEVLYFCSKDCRDRFLKSRQG